MPESVYRRIGRRSQLETEGRPMAFGFMFRLELEDGSPADPPTLRTALLSWRAGDTIPLGGRTLRVVGVRDDDADRPPALVVRGLSESD